MSHLLKYSGSQAGMSYLFPPEKGTGVVFDNMIWIKAPDLLRSTATIFISVVWQEKRENNEKEQLEN